MTGTPLASASPAVSPPAFCTTTSQARISSGMLSTHPNTSPWPARARRRRSSSLCPHTTTGRAALLAATSLAICSTAPTAQDPHSTRASRWSWGNRNSARARRRSPWARAGRNPGAMACAATSTRRAPSRAACSAAILFGAMVRSARRVTAIRCTEGSVRYSTNGAVSRPRRRSAARQWLAAGCVETTRSTSDPSARASRRPTRADSPAASRAAGRQPSTRSSHP